MKTKHHRTAGGVVLDAKGRVLVITRDVMREGGLTHEVRLPKGHLDPGETEEAGAMREVGEESGYWNLRIVAGLGEAVSEFDFKKKHHVREERYFLMALTSPDRGAPAPTGKEEALFSPAWMDLAEAEMAMTYASEQDFVARARAWVEEHGWA